MPTAGRLMQSQAPRQRMVAGNTPGSPQLASLQQQQQQRGPTYAPQGQAMSAQVRRPASAASAASISSAGVQRQPSGRHVQGSGGEVRSPVPSSSEQTRGAVSVNGAAHSRGTSPKLSSSKMPLGQVKPPERRVSVENSVRRQMEEIAQRAEGVAGRRSDGNGQVVAPRQASEEVQRPEIEDLRRQLKGLGSSLSGPGGSKEEANSAPGARAASALSATGTGTAETRASSPGAGSLADSTTERGTSAVAKEKERQLAELRAQVARCGKLYGGSSSPPAGAPAVGLSAEVAHPEPERTGTRSPLQVTTATRPAGTLEEELAWTVQQMEVHRRQIEAHQRQLSILERRHAELVTVLTRGSGLGGQSSAGSSVAGKLFSAEAGHQDSDTAFSAAAAAAAHSEVASNSSSGAGGSLGFASAMAAAEARLGLRSRGSRPTSASSGLSAGLSAAAREGGPRTPLMQRGTARPLSAGSGDWEEDASAHSGHAAPSSPLEMSVTASSSALIASNINKQQEAELISCLLAQLNARRPTRLPFVAMGADEGQGQPYLHGSLEVRLLLSEDANRLLVRVSNSGNGKLLEISDFVAKAEAIEARRRSPRSRPNTIAEETEPGLTEPDLLGSNRVQSQISPSSQVQAQPLSTSSPPSNGSQSTWKTLFKAHWPSR
eukprot:TRINITY_DN63055_c0_g1_i1.p1 TRINITY_DN63055_c0_g1~~TRINITY_DN63055_c0_g1_i1.p1  ORF type:complete len:699 (-),score=126.01 TRINITY_DN63055_c0_g1_i1:133-2118(-)